MLGWVEERWRVGDSCQFRGLGLRKTSPSNGCLDEQVYQFHRRHSLDHSSNLYTGYGHKRPVRALFSFDISSVTRFVHISSTYLGKQAYTKFQLFGQLQHLPIFPFISYKKKITVDALYLKLFHFFYFCETTSKITSFLLPNPHGNAVEYGSTVKSHFESHILTKKDVVAIKRKVSTD